MKVYVASSWRNPIQDVIVTTLRAVGHEVYDFKNPAEGQHGFAWGEIDPAWESWTPDEWIAALDHPLAEHGFGLDMNALWWCEACVLILPCGRSAHLELGWACGAGKLTVGVALPEVGPHEPELMYRMLDATVTSMHSLIETLAGFTRQRPALTDAASGEPCP